MTKKEIKINNKKEIEYLSFGRSISVPSEILLDFIFAPKYELRFKFWAFDNNPKDGRTYYVFKILSKEEYEKRT